MYFIFLDLVLKGNKPNGVLTRFQVPGPTMYEPGWACMTFIYKIEQELSRLLVVKLVDNTTAKLVASMRGNPRDSKLIPAYISIYSDVPYKASSITSTWRIFICILYFGKCKYLKKILQGNSTLQVLMYSVYK